MVSYPNKNIFLSSAYLNQEQGILTTLKVFLVMSSAVLFLSTHQPVLAAGLMGHEMEVVRLTNQLRQSQGVSMLVMNSQLASSAQAKANDMAANNYFGHADKSGNRMAYWMKVAGYSYIRAGENLAEGFNSTAELMQAWTNSPTHYANLINSNYREIGVGIAQGFFNGNLTIFVVQHFGEPTLQLAVPNLAIPGTAGVMGDNVASTTIIDIVPPSTDGGINLINLALNQKSGETVSKAANTPAGFLLTAFLTLQNDLSKLGILPQSALASSNQLSDVALESGYQVAQATFVILVVLGLLNWLLMLIWPVFYAAWLGSQEATKF